MRLLIVLFFSMSLFANSCYTVQITSSFNSEKNYSELSQSNYPQSCKLMEIGKTLTVRCGCHEKYKDAKATLPELQKKYQNAYISTTYKSRFERKKPEVLKVQESNSTKVQEVVVLATKQQDTNETLVKRVVPEAVKKPDANSTQVQEIIALPIQPEKVIHTSVIKPLRPLKEEKIEKSKKVKKKKVKKKKKSKKRYSKKREQKYFYTRYLDKLESKKGMGPFDYRYKFGTQISYDLAHIAEADTSYNVTDWRRIRVSHSGSFLDESLFYELEYSFTGQNHYKDIYIGYKNKIKPLDLKYRVKFGNIKIPFSLEQYSSSKNITFMERALTDGYLDNRKFGGELLLSKPINKDTLNLFISTFSNSIDENIDNEVEKPGQAIRLTYTHKYQKQHLVSVGSAFMNRDMKGEDVKFNQASESEFIQEKYVSVRIKDVDRLKKLNFESLYIYNNYSLQGEYTSVDVLALKDNYTFNAYYLQGSYFPIGKGRRYKTSNSTLGKIKPTKDGALELAFRYSYINLNDDGENGVNPEHGGQQSDYNFGVNWYINSEFKMMFNYIIAEPKGTDEYDGRLQIFQMRTLFTF